MNPKHTALLVVLFVVIVAGTTALVFIPAKNAVAPNNPPASARPAALDDLIVVEAPLADALVTSPITISGKARGNWYFEASAPVELRDTNGTIIAQGHIEAQGDWMTSEYVPFTATLTFTSPAAKTGLLILKNDNPSGDPTREKQLVIPVRFR